MSNAPTTHLPPLIFTGRHPVRVRRWPKLTRVQWALLVVASLPTVVAAGWPVLDALYGEEFGTPDPWWACMLAALGGWLALVVRGGQERIMRGQQAIISNQAAINQYNADLAERLDTYGDACRIEGHRLASAIRGGNGRHLQPVD